MNRLADFIRDLSENPDKLLDFQQDPDAVMDKAGLNDDEKELIRSGDEGRIAEALGFDTAARLFVFRIRNIRVRFGV